MGLTRRMWEVVEPLHACVYFAPEPADAARSSGLRGWWMGYFAGRFAPCGAIGPATATAMAFGFAPGMVARSLPDAWSYASPGEVLSGRRAAAAAALRRAAGDEWAPELASLLRRAADGCRFDGRPLAAGWAGWAEASMDDDAVACAWTWAGVLREHRGDGHVLSAVALGLTGLEATVTLVAAGAMGRPDIQPHRGWTDAEWDDAAMALQERGLVAPSGEGLTAEGVALRAELEARTDALAGDALRALDDTETARLLTLATRVSRAVAAAGDFPVPNPIGAPAP